MAPFIEDGGIHLGPEGGARHPSGRPGLADARLGQAHIQVGAHRHVDQGRQGRIIKGGPPFHQRHRIDGGLAGLAGVTAFWPSQVEGTLVSGGW